MAAKSFYPNLSTIVTVDTFPEELQFIENGLQNDIRDIMLNIIESIIKDNILPTL